MTSAQALDERSNSSHVNSILATNHGSRFVLIKIASTGGGALAQANSHTRDGNTAPSAPARNLVFQTGAGDEFAVL